MAIQNKRQQFIQIFTASIMLLAIVGSIAFCFLTIESVGDMGHTSNQAHSSFPMHIDHMQTLNSANISQANSFSVLIATLLTLITFIFVLFSHTPLHSPQHSAHRKRRQSTTTLVDQFELHWLSRFVRSPDFLRLA